MNNICGTLFPSNRHEPFIDDQDGCLLCGKNSNHEKHLFLNHYDGKYVVWYYDFCGCEDCRTDYQSDMCITYCDFDNIAAAEKDILSE